MGEILDFLLIPNKLPTLSLAAVELDDTLPLQEHKDIHRGDCVVVVVVHALSEFSLLKA